MIEADRADHSRAKLDHDLIVPITSFNTLLTSLLSSFLAGRTVSVVRKSMFTTQYDRIVFLQFFHQVWRHNSEQGKKLLICKIMTSISVNQSAWMGNCDHDSGCFDPQGSDELPWVNYK